MSRNIFKIFSVLMVVTTILVGMTPVSVHAIPNNFETKIEWGTWEDGQQVNLFSFRSSEKEDVTVRWEYPNTGISSVLESFSHDEWEKVLTMGDPNNYGFTNYFSISPRGSGTPLVEYEWLFENCSAGLEISVARNGLSVSVEVTNNTNAVLFLPEPTLRNVMIWFPPGASEEFQFNQIGEYKVFTDTKGQESCAEFSWNFYPRATAHQVFLPLLTR